jgi:4-amino-4-deoxy-L-arabinose transferase-like glycosyltransferase
VSPRHRTRLGLGLLVLASVAARLTSPAESDLHPWPDAPEYAATAVGLLERGSFLIPYAGQWVPPGHGFGFPLLIAPVLAALGHDYGNAVWATLAMHILELLLVFRLAERCYGPLAGLLAVAFVAGSPVDAELSRRIMSEVPSSALIMGALVLLCGAEAVPGGARMFACGVALGVACWIRYANALLIVPVAVVAFAIVSPLPDRLRRSGWLLAGFLLALVPIGVYNVVTLGALFRMPHSIWVPDHKALFLPFRLGHALPDGKAARYLAALLGNPDSCLDTTRQLYPSFVAALAIVAWARWPGRPRLTPPAVTLHRVAPAIVAILLALCSFYFFENELRLLHAVVPIVCTIAAGSAVRIFSPPVPRGLARWAPAGVWLLALALPAWTLGRTALDGPLLRGVVLGIEVPPPIAREHMRLINEVTQPDAWILSDSFEPVFFSVEQRARRRLLLIDEEGVAADAAAVQSVAEVPGSLERLLSRGERVYFVGDVHRLKRRRGFRGYAVERVAARSTDHGRVLLEVWRLTRRADGDGDPDAMLVRE